jgi:hypothetical protein
MEWQPIETAPKDGQHIILALSEGWIGVGYYDDDPEFSSLGWVVFGSGQQQPTHWMPLPEPPKGA